MMPRILDYSCSWMEFVGSWGPNQNERVFVFGDWCSMFDVVVVVGCDGREKSALLVM